MVLQKKDSFITHVITIMPYLTNWGWLVIRIECWFVGPYDPTSRGTSIVLRLYSGLFLFCFPLLHWFIYFSSIFSVFCLFPLLSQYFLFFFYFVPLFFLYLLCFFSQLCQQPIDPTYETCYDPHLYYLSPTYRPNLNTRTWLHLYGSNDVIISYHISHLSNLLISKPFL